MKGGPHHILSAMHSVNVISLMMLIDHLAGVAFVRFLHCEVFFKRDFYWFFYFCDSGGEYVLFHLFIQQMLLLLLSCFSCV